MRAVVQRVTSARVTVDDEIVGSIDEPGLVVLLGVTHDDGLFQVERLASKVWRLRIMRDECSASDLGAPLLVVSQFTLYGDTRKGRRPTWNSAAPGEVSEPLYEAFCEQLRTLGAKVESGTFGAQMAVELVNDGPTTLIVDA